MTVSRASRVLLLSFAYEPDIGGIESVSLTLGRILTDRGYDLTVVTVVPGPSTDSNGLRVLRRPTPRALVRAIRWADVVVQSNVSLALGWPLLLRVVRRPWLVVNHTSIAPPGRPARLRDRLKQRTLPHGATFAVSAFLAREIPRSVGVLPNPFDEAAFHPGDPAAARSSAVLFVGRLVEAKGADVLIDALALLRRDGLPERAVVIGDGPDRAALEERAHEAGLGDAVQFLGALPAREVGQAMRRHRVLVVPSRVKPPEALGMVAIEGLASGCTVVVADQGGLPEAVGAAGIVVRPEDPAALAAALRQALHDRSLVQAMRERAAAQVDRYRVGPVAERYAAELERLMGSSRRGRSHRAAAARPSRLARSSERG